MPSPDRFHVFGGLNQRLDAHLTVSFVGVLHRHADNHPGLEINGMLGFVRQVRATVLYLRDLRIGILGMSSNHRSSLSSSASNRSGPESRAPVSRCPRPAPLRGRSSAATRIAACFACRFRLPIAIGDSVVRCRSCRTSLRQSRIGNRFPPRCGEAPRHGPSVHSLSKPITIRGIVRQMAHQSV